MSSEALAWAFKQDVKPSSAKFVLVAMAECAHYQTGKIFPSIAHLADITGLNRKTIIASVAALENDGYISDTGERAGFTGQIKVYRANIGTVPELEQSQKRNSTKNGTVPILRDNSTVFTRKQSQKRDTYTSIEPSIETTPPASARTANPFPRPEGVDPQHWIDFLSNRKRKRAANTATAHKKLMDDLNRLSRNGWNAPRLIEHAAAMGWAGIYDPGDGGGLPPRQATATPSHSEIIRRKYASQ